MHISIEGNVACGKTSAIRCMKTAVGQQLVNVVEEPIEAWNSMFGVEWLSQFMNAQSPYQCLMLQLVVMVSYRSILLSNTRPLLLTERSAWSSVHIFCRANLTRDGLTLMQGMYQTMGFKDPHILVYIRTDPAICMRRMLGRAREGEAYTLEQLRALHKAHEDHLTKHPRCVVVNGNQNTDDVAKEISDMIASICVMWRACVALFTYVGLLICTDLYLVSRED